MTLEQNILLFLPLSPQPADDNLVAISNALELAITACIRLTFVPVGFGAIFIGAAPPNPFNVALGMYLEAVLSPIITTAASAQISIGPIAAWAAAQPALLALAATAPPFMPGILGIPFWASILFTIGLATPIVPPEESSGNSSAGGEDTEVLRIDT